MHKLVFPEKLVKLSRFLNNEKYARVKIGKQLSSEYKVNKGLRQGDAITFLLFNVVLENAIRRSKAELGKPYLTNVVKLWHVLMEWLL